MLKIVEVNDRWWIQWGLYSLYMFQSCHYEKSKATIIQVEWALLKCHKLKKMNIKIPRAKNKNVCKPNAWYDSRY